MTITDEMTVGGAWESAVHQNQNSSRQPHRVRTRQSVQCSARCRLSAGLGDTVKKSWSSDEPFEFPAMPLL